MPSTGDVRPGYTSESGMVQRHVDHEADGGAANSHNHNHNSSPPAVLLTSQPQSPTAAQQQQQHSQQQQFKAVGSPLDTPQSPRSPVSPRQNLLRHESESAEAAAAVDPSPDPAAAPGDRAPAAEPLVAAVTAPRESNRTRKASSDSSSSRRHSGQTAAAGASASRSSGPEPSRTPRDEDLGTCPPYATKAVWGLRYSMEDKWAAVPNLIQVCTHCSIEHGVFRGCNWDSSPDVLLSIQCHM